MPNIKPIETYYNGYRFRSRLEARWALYFDERGIQYEYEPEGLVLHDGTKYLPDFYLPQFSCYFEVKRKSIKGTEEETEARRKISDGAYSDTWAGMICFGDPYDRDVTIYCQESDESGGGSYEGQVVFGQDPDTNEPVLFVTNDIRERTFFSTWGGNEIPMTTSCYGHYEEKEFINHYEIINAELHARRARFEHGETPNI